MSIKIETSIALPISKKGGTREGKYPFKLLPEPTKDKDGQDLFASFFVGPAKAINVSQAAAIFGKKNGTKYKVRVEENGVRVWRVK